MRDTILHLADLHLDASPEARLDDAVRAWLLGARRRILNALASWIARDESRIGLVLIAGDLFDRHDPPQEVVSEARTALAEIARLVPVVTVPGNHDEYSYAQCVYRRGDWPGVLVTSPEPQLVWKGQLGDSVCAVVSAAYQAGKVSPGQRLRFPSRSQVMGGDDSNGVLIGLFHSTLADHFPDEFVRNERCFVLSHQEAANAGYDYLALGHFHTRREWRIGACLAHYPGPPLGARIADPGSGQLSLVRIRNGTVTLEGLSAGPMVGCQWMFLDVELQPEEKPREVVERIADRCRNVEANSGIAAIHVARLKGNTIHDNLAEQIQNELRAKGVSCTVVADELEEILSPDIEAMAAEESLVGYFVRSWQEWQSRQEVSRAEAMAVLYEGLLALGWHRANN